MRQAEAVMMQANEMGIKVDRDWGGWPEIDAPNQAGMRQIARSYESIPSPPDTPDNREMVARALANVQWAEDIEQMGGARKDHIKQFARIKRYLRGMFR
jgi:hypothetical protein